jgi:enoyl-CoA hydratase
LERRKRFLGIAGEDPYDLLRKGEMGSSGNILKQQEIEPAPVLEEVKDRPPLPSFAHLLIKISGVFDPGKETSEQTAENSDPKGHYGMFLYHHETTPALSMPNGVGRLVQYGARLVMGKKLHYSREGDLAIFTMDDGKVNTIEGIWIEEWEGVLKEIQNNPPGALIIRGREGVFSAGLDLKILPTYSPSEFTKFVGNYEQAMRSLFLLEIPVVAEVTGHALAGGAVLLLACDFRISDPSPKKIGLNETQIGVTLPPFVIAMAQAVLLPSSLPSALMAGEIYGPEDALRIGYLTSIVPEKERSRFALETARTLAQLPPEPYRRVKRYLRERALEGVPFGPMGGSSSLAETLLPSPPPGGAPSP